MDLLISAFQNFSITKAKQIKPLGNYSNLLPDGKGRDGLGASTLDFSGCTELQTSD